ncbi:hypothetical protein ACF0H5_023502 [Mactra antiquata]
MNHRYTVLLLVVLGIVITTGTYVGTSKIKCWVPAEFEKEWFAPYVNDHCWISNTYRVPMTERIPSNIEERQNAEITYYQWVPLILALQAFLFHLPYILWNVLVPNSGLNLRKIQDLAEKSQSNSPSGRSDAIDTIADVIKRWIEVSRPYEINRLNQARSWIAKVFCFYCSKRQGTFITGLYLSIKLLYLANVFGQFYLLNAFMGTGFNLYGYEYINSLATGSMIKESPRFPRVTLCDLQIRQLQNVQRYTVQCVLPINLFNEVVFLFMWFWFVFIAFITLISFIQWVYKVMSKRYAYMYVKKYLSLNDPKLVLSTEDKINLKVFAERYLRKDGCYVTWMVGHNSTDLVVIDLIVQLWEDYKKAQSEKTTGVISSHTELKHS